MSHPIQKAFAVRLDAANRSTAYNGNSSTWTLYDPDTLLADLAGILPPGCAPTREDLDSVLEKNGFFKAVTIREEVLLWKERLRREETQIQNHLHELGKQRQKLGQRLSEVREQLQNVRNLLRLPRAKA